MIETRVRIPDGDAVQRVWSVPDLGGLTVIEVENESPLPFAVAFAGPRVLTERPPADVPIKGLDLPAGFDRAACRAPIIDPGRRPPRPGPYRHLGAADARCPRWRSCGAG